jgi:flavorubredoxin
MKCIPLYRKDGHRWLMFGRDADRGASMIDTNQFAIETDGEVMLLDPGGLEVFPSMMAALTQECPMENIRHLFFSHQDPDVASGLAVWRQTCRPDIQIHISWMWSGFVAHYDSGAQLSPIADPGGTIRLGRRTELRFIPAHYLHSPGNFSLYDPAARILFTGDIGATTTVASADGIFVSDFASHATAMEPFHRRWMGCTQARDAWIRRVASLDVDILAPQHGLLMRGDDVRRFLDWFASLPLASGIESM